MKLNDKHQLLVYANDVNVLGENTQTIKESTKAVAVAIKEIGLQVQY